MRIGIDARLWNETGVGRYTRNLIGNLLQIDKANDYVLFVLSKDRKEIQQNLPTAKCQLQTADIRWHSIAEQKEFPKILAYADLDLVHFPYFSVPLLYTKPFVVTIHDLILHHFSTGEASTLPLPVYKLKHSLYKQVVDSAAKRAKKIITVSEATKKEIVEHLHVQDDKVIVTYEGVQAAKSKEQRAKSLRGEYFLHVGNVYPHKNADRLVEAFEAFKKDSSPMAQNDTKLIFVGKDDYFMQKLRTKVATRKIENIVFLGEVSDGELQGLYQGAIALVSPSLMEGFGLPTVEAMASRCLVLLSDIPSYKEVVGSAGIYFDPHSISDIAEKFMNTYSMSHDEKAEKITKGLSRVKEYSWKKMAEQTLRIYEDCLGVRSGK